MQMKTFAFLAFVGGVMSQDAPWCKFSRKATTGNDYAIQQATVVIPKDGSATESGYDAANNCGGGYRDNLNGRGAILYDYTCTYGPDNSACVKMTVEAWGSGDDIGAAYDAATGGLQIACEESAPLQEGYFKCPWE